jgi:YD repeat-containing protein
MVPTIPFDLPLGTSVTAQFEAQGVIFGGSGPQAIQDGNSTSNPVLSGTPKFDGDITGYFVDPVTGEDAPVYVMFFDVGGFDSTNTVLLEFFGPDGSLLYSFENDATGFVRYAAFGGPYGIASWRFSNLSTTDPDGFGIDNLTFSTPGEDNLGEELGITDCLLGNPVNPLTGNKVQIETDYVQSKPFPLKVERSYNSSTGEWLFLQKLDHAFGSDHAQVIRPDGKRRTFSRLVDSDWQSINPAVDSTLGVATDTQGNPSGWVHRTSDDMAYRYDIAGRLVSVTNRAGIEHTYAYQPGSITVTHSLGGTLTYHLDNNGRIESFTDPDGYQYHYDYNADGLVSAITYPQEIGSPYKLYRYEDEDFPDLLTSIMYNDTDDTYQFAYWRYDDARRAIQSTRAGGSDTVRFDYSNLERPDQPHTRTTNPLGKETSYYITKVNGTRKTYYVLGHPSDNCQSANQAYSYYVSGHLGYKRDWNGNVTTYQRNAKGQETSRTEAAGTDQERTITTDWHNEFNLPVRVEEPGRVTTFHYDSRGNLLQHTVEDTTAP